MSILTGNLIHKPIIITIFGNVSSGKTPWAEQLFKKAQNLGYKVLISDHYLFSFRKSYKKDYEKIIEKINNDNIDVGILVVGTGNDRSIPFSIEISPQITAPLDILGLLCGWVENK